MSSQRNFNIKMKNLLSHMTKSPSFHWCRYTCSALLTLGTVCEDQILEHRWWVNSDLHPSMYLNKYLVSWDKRSIVSSQVPTKWVGEPHYNVYPRDEELLERVALPNLRSDWKQQAEEIWEILVFDFLDMIHIKTLTVIWSKRSRKLSLT